AAAALVDENDGDAAQDDESDPGEREPVRQRTEDHQSRQHRPNREAIEEGRYRRGPAEPIGEQDARMAESDVRKARCQPAGARQLSKPRDMRPDASITVTLVAKVMTMTGMCAGAARPARSRAAIRTADAKANRAAGEIPEGPGWATRKAPAKPISASATRAAPTRSRMRKATARIRIRGAVWRMATAS